MRDRREGERVAKILARRGLCSRREAEELIAEGVVRVHGEIVSRPATLVPPDAPIEVDPAALARLRQKPTVLLNKPPGVESISRERQAGAAGLVRPELAWRTSPVEVKRVLAFSESLAVAGRLDRASRGLLVLTADGRVARALVGGRGVPKRYRVRVDGEVTAGQVRKLRALRVLANRPIRPMEVARISPTVLRFTLVEGRKHQIRLACRHVGLQVRDLLRESVGPISLGELPEGRWRAASPDEVAALLQAAGEAE